MTVGVDRQPLVVRGVGMTTPIGDGADAACAALRAGLSRFREMPWIALEDREKKPIVAVGATAFEEGLTGLGRFTRLAANALRDLFQSTSMSAESLADAAMYVALPTADRGGIDPRTHGELGAQLHEWLGLAPAAATSGLRPPVATAMRVFPRGHAGFMEALLAAERDLAAKRIARAIVGGVDSLVDPATVRWLHAARRLKAGGRPVGLFPGEGAAFTLLERSALPLSMGPQAAPNPAGGPAAKAAVSILGTAITMESATQGRDAPCTGAGLGEAILRTRDELDDAGDGIGLVVSDMNGEPYRSEEIGYALTRALSFTMGPAPQGAVATSPRPQPGDAYGPPRGPKSPFRLWHAADAIGDTGAAAPAIALGMAARALVRGYARTTTALVLASSDDGLRGSFAVQLGTTKG